MKVLALSLRIIYKPSVAYQPSNCKCQTFMNNSVLTVARHCEKQLEIEDWEEAKRLMIDDTYLMDVFRKSLQSCAEVLSRITHLVSLLHEIHSRLSKNPKPWSEIYCAGMAGQLLDSDFVKDFLSAIKRLSSQNFSVIIDIIAQHQDLNERLTSLQRHFKSFLESLPEGPTANLKSGHDMQHDSLRTTVVAQKVKLSQQTSQQSQAEGEYTQHVDQFCHALEEYLKDSLLDPQVLFPIEVLLYDAVVPYRDITTPQPRFAIERALLRSQDYVGHGYAVEPANYLSAYQSASSVLYQLHLECGGLFNVADLWSAFWTRTKPQTSKDAESEEEYVLARFELSLAELKAFGMLRQSRGNGDGMLTQLSWKGL